MNKPDFNDQFETIDSLNTIDHFDRIEFIQRQTISKTFPLKSQMRN